MLWESFDILFSLARMEDLSIRGDVTSDAIFTDEVTDAVLVSKDEGVLAGIAFFREVFIRMDSRISIISEKNDGDLLKKGDRIATLTGPARSVLRSERMALNFVSYLSGIASASARYRKEAARYGKTVILDTRKTLPGYRALAKYAVTVGGAQNHRQGLYDMVLIKDNHIDAAGGLGNAVQKVRDKWGNSLQIEVECRTIAEVKQAIKRKVDIIMLDNMMPGMISEALALESRGIRYEISGNMDFEKLKDYAGLGADYISAGALTHSVKIFDFSLQVNIKR
ncbi:MAG: carboxylating nicotinate-nucleotide diphosphorylase [Spirochaetales bacterium]|nr:carboxylating nicotinate-nucleotide diphosphorylase [Spirochaetales bacterium]